MVKNIDFFGENTEFDHLGLVVKSIKDIDPTISIIYDKNQHVNVAFTLINGVNFEYIEPIDETSPVYSLIKNPNKIAHVCYKVDNIFNSIKLARTNGFLCIRQPIEAIAFNNKLISFVAHKHFGIIELVEK